FFTVMSSGDFEVGLHSFWIGGIDPDMTLYEHFYTGSDRNYGRYSNPEVDKLIDKQSATLDKEERRKIAWDAIEMAWRTGAKQLLSTTMYQPIVGGRMRGYMPAPNYIVGYGSPLRFQHVWLTEK
ncbi:MAG: hypothetical protein HY688_03640, partial [Chloroflexi bacterium]|nr:hypothetical protein [Chloroflexota bacterium]